MNEEAIKRAFENYRKAVEAERSLNADIVARADNPRPTAEEQEQLERMDQDIVSWKHEVERLEDLGKRAKDAEETRSRIEDLLVTDADEGRSDSSKTDAVRLGEAIRSYQKTGAASAFESRLSHTFMEARALGSTGGTAVPTTFYDRVTVFEQTATPMLDPAVVTILNTTSGEAITLPRLTANPTAAGTLTAEAGTFTEADPTISSVTLNAYKYGGITLWSAELDADNVIGIENLLGQSLANEIVFSGAGPALTTADGSSKPHGIVAAAANGGTASGTANNTFFGPGDIVDLFYGRAQPYRRVGNWMASSTGLAKIRKLQDSTGQLIWQPSLVAGQPETVLGRPIFENPDMATPASAAKSVLFGDTHRYFVRRAGALRIEISRDYKFNTDQLAIKAVERLDGELVDGAAVAYLVCANA